MIKRRVTGEKEVFDKIWMDRDHISEISGIQLEQYVHPLYFNMFAHIVCKKDYPNFRLEEFNIVLLTPEEHRIYDSGNKEKVEEYRKRMAEKGVDVKWDWLFEKKKTISEAYNEIYESKIVPRDFARRFCTGRYDTPEGDLGNQDE